MRAIKHIEGADPVDNPMISRWSETAGEDPAYMRIKEAREAGKSNRSLPQEEEGSRMGGEWSKLEVLQGTNLLVLDGQRIYLPEECRQEVIETIHTSHGKAPMMGTTIRELYFWPRQRQQLQEHAENCDICLEFR